MRLFWKRIWLMINIALGVILIFSGYGGIVSPLRHTLPALAAMTFPGWLVLTLLLSAINLWRARGAAVVNLLSLLICWSPIASFCPLHFGEKADGTTMTLMSYNVLHLQDYTQNSDSAGGNPTLEYIMKRRPDIAALQECESFAYAGTKRIGHAVEDSLKSIYPYRKASPEGQALLSRYPFKEIRLHYLPGSNFQVRAYRIDSPLGQVTLFNIHLQSIGLTDSDKELYRQFTDGRAARQPIKQELSELRHDVVSKLSTAFRQRAVQAAKVKELVDSVGGTVIVCGDFNDIQSCYACREILSAGLTDAYAASGLGPAITYHASRFFFRIDHIFYSDSLRSIRTRKESNPTSDHYPIVTTLSRSKLADSSDRKE